MSSELPSDPNKDEFVSPRMEGRMRALDGILRTKIGQRGSRAGARALQELRGEPVEAHYGRKTATSRQTPVSGSRRVEPIEARASRSHLQAVSASGRVAAAPRVKARFSKFAVWLGGAAAALIVGATGLWLAFVVIPNQSALRVAELNGEVMVGARTLQKGDFLFPGQQVTTRSGASAKLVYKDGTAVDVPGDSTLDIAPNREIPGKNLFLTKGAFTANVSPQPADEPMVITTPAASVEVVGTSFTVAARGNATDLDVEHGKVNLVRTMDRKSIPVSGGYSAIASPSMDLVARPLKFVKGVNLGGKGVVIDGNRWQGYPEALSDGLSVPAKISTWDWKEFKPVGVADRDLVEVLQTGIWTAESRGDEPLVMHQKLANGEYKVYLWNVENARSYFRRMTVILQGQVVATGIGGSLAYGSYGKYGPYPARVVDGVLTLEINAARTGGGERHVNGFAIFKVGE